MFLSLENSIKELHEMFMDMAVMVENQGEMINRSEDSQEKERASLKDVLRMILLRIDTHIESATEYTGRASNDTKKALEYQQKARRSVHWQGKEK